MAKPAPCPQCKESLRTVTLILGRTSYCLSCGWNCEEAQGQIRARTVIDTDRLGFSIGSSGLCVVQASGDSLDGCRNFGCRNGGAAL